MVIFTLLRFAWIISALNFITRCSNSSTVHSFMLPLMLSLSSAQNKDLVTGKFYVVDNCNIFPVVIGVHASVGR